MAEKLGKELLNSTEGVALVEAADAPLVRNAFEDLSQAMGSDIEFAPDELAGVNESVGNVVDVAQGLALPLATVLIMYAGFKHMVSGGRRKKGRA